MMVRFWILVVALLSVEGAFAGQQDNYPFSIENEREGDGHRIVARNSGPAPISVKVFLPESVNAASDRPFPVFAVVPPGGGTLYLARIRPAIAGMGYSFRTQSSWLLGDFNARHSPDAIYRLPYQDGMAFTIGQAPGGPITTHNHPQSQYAVDIGMPQGTTVLAARDGVVIHAEANQVYGGKDPELLSKANEVRIRHIDGTIAIYAHLAHGGVFVYPGQTVLAGTPIGLAGSTGYSSGPHLHFAVQTVVRSYDDLTIVSLPFRFYVGNPPLAFSPKYGTLARADYGGPVSVPGIPAPTIAARSPLPAPSSATGSPDILISLRVPPSLRAALVAVPAWFWFVGAVMAVLLLLGLTKSRTARQRREQFVLHEPGIWSRPSDIARPAGVTAWSELVSACAGDHQTAARLVVHEREADPGCGNEEAARRALERLCRDRR